MVGEQKLKQIAKDVLALSKGDETEVILMVSENALTRFANSQIHQNMEWEDLGISVRVILGKRIGVASGNNFAKKALEDIVERATELAKLQKEDLHFQGLPKPQKIPRLKERVYRSSEKLRAEVVNAVIQQAKKKNIIASGAFSCPITEIAVANSHGIFAYHSSSAADLSTIMLGVTSTGFASDVGPDPKKINPEKVADTALNKVIKGENPIDVAPGDWDVILEPQAVSELMAFFSWLGPNARIYYEQASCLSGKLGKKVFGENVSIIDDPLNQDSMPLPFDFEGVPKKRLEIIKNGVLKNLVYDSYYANRYKQKNTGHALPAPNTAGPIPIHLTMTPGKKSIKDIIARTKKGLLVSRLWYVRVLNTKQLSLTGMTRDGTFLIENGKLLAGVKNLRFNQSIPETFNNVLEVSRQIEPVASFEAELGISRMPYLKIKNWHFSSGTLF